MNSSTKNFQTERAPFVVSARQIRVEGVDDTVAVGYVRDYGPGRAAYLVFFGKQGKPAKHYSVSSVDKAEKEVIAWLTRAREVAERKAAERKQPRKLYHEEEEKGVVRRSYTTAGTAQLIREALKAAFPNVKFSVLSETYAGGSSVRISYTDGPNRHQVEKITDQFKCGYYNSSEEIYEYKADSTTVGPSGELMRVSYGAKYISSQRSYSPSYGFFLNGLDLRQRPTLSEQFNTFYEWHRRQRYNMDCSYGEHKGTHTVTSNNSSGDLERFGQALTVQGHTVMVSTTGGVTCLAVSGPSEPDLTDPIPSGPAVALPVPHDEPDEPQASAATGNAISTPLTPLQQEVLALLKHPAFTAAEQAGGKAAIVACAIPTQLDTWSKNLVRRATIWEDARLAQEAAGNAPGGRSEEPNKQAIIT